MSNKLSLYEELAKDQGWRMEDGAKHRKWYHPDGERFMVTRHNEDGYDENRTSRLNMEKAWRDAGLKIPDDREQHMERRARKSIQPTVKRFFADNPDKTFFADEIHLHVKTKVGEVSKNSISMCLSTLAEQDYLIRVGRGEYRYRKPLSERPAVVAPQTEKPPPKLDVAEYANSTEDERILNESLAALGRIEESIKGILNEALTSLGRIEEVVRRNRDVARLLVELKEKLK